MIKCELNWKNPWRIILQIKDENEDDKVESKDPDYEPGLEFD